MGIKLGVSLLGMILLGSSAFAAGTTDTTYTCTLQIIDANSEVIINKDFQAQAVAGTHAGDGAVFTSKDGSTQATVAIDGKWIILNWSNKGGTVANIVFVTENISDEARVAIAYNPKNVEEQASLSCSPNAASANLH